MNITLVFIFIIGLCIGSFLNVCIYRIPKEESIINPPSHCPSCNQRLGVLDLIPVFSYIFLLGKCRNCKSKISARYPLVEIISGILLTALFIKFGLTLNFVLSSAIVLILTAILFIDLDHMIIPDGLNLILGVLGITLNILYPIGGYKNVILNMMLGFLLGGGIFFIFGLLGAMGGGDIKLMAALGLIFGWKLLIPIMLISFILGGIIGGVLLMFKIKGMKDMIPFGPYIAIASIIVVFYGQTIINWYLSYYRL